MIKELLTKLGAKGIVGLVALESFEVLFWIILFVKFFEHVVQW